jgi:hypothetical protein
LWNAARGGIGNAKCKMQLPSGRKVTGKIVERCAGYIRISYLVSRISYLVSRISYLVSRISYLVGGTTSGFVMRDDMGEGQAEDRGQRTEVRSQKSEVRSQKSEVRSQKSEVRSQKSEVRSQKTVDS